MRSPDQYETEEIMKLGCATAIRLGILRNNPDTILTLTYDEVNQVSILTHLKCMEKWSPDKNVKYSSYFVAAVTHELHQAIKANRGYKRNHDYKNGPDTFSLCRESQAGSREQDPAELAELDEIRENLYPELVKNKDLLNLLVIRATGSQKEFEEASKQTRAQLPLNRMEATQILAELIRRQGSHPAVVAIVKRLEAVRNSLTPEQTKLLCLRFLAGEPIRDICVEYKLSHQGCYNIIYSQLWRYI